MAQLTDSHALLIYRVGPVLCCAPTLSVTTLMSPPSLTQLPNCSDSLPGIFRQDGQLVSLIELRHLFGVEQQDRTQPGRIIICRLADRHLGFLVDEVIDVIRTPEHGWRQLSPSLSGGVFNRSLLLNEKLHLYCEFEKLQMIRNSGFLKPWIQQLQEKKQPKENTRIPSSTVTEKTPRPTEAVVESSRTAPPPATPSAADSGFHSQQSAAPLNPQRPNAHNKTDKIRNRHKHSAIKSTPQTRNKKQQTTICTSPEHSGKAPPRISAASAVPPPSSAATLHPAADRLDFDTRPQAPVPTNRAGTELPITAIVLIGAGLITALVYLWPKQHTNPVIRSAVDTFVAETLTPANLPPPLPENTRFSIANKSSHKMPNTAQEDETEETDATPPHDGLEQETRYHASIEQQHHELTIILTAPANDTVIRTDTGHHPGQGQSTEIHSALESAPVPTSAASHLPTSQHMNEVVHTVVRGDTLWHIARRYIHNPFRYPELARLNKIRNPNLIYPGDRVRIIRIYRQSPPPNLAN